MSWLLAAVGALIVVAVGMIMIRTVRTGTPPMPSGRRMRAVMLSACDRAVATGGVARIVELGCGWGGFTRSLAARFPHLPVQGIEISAVPYLVARLSAWRSRSNLRIIRGDVAAFAPQPGDLLVSYLSRPHMKVIAELLERSGDPEVPVWLVSSTFALPGAEPAETLVVPDLYGSPVYVYAVRRGFSV